MIAVDSMIWVYNCDRHAKEYGNVNRWLEGKGGEEGVIDREEILLTTIIVMEVIHNLRRRGQVQANLVYNYVLKMVGLKNVIVAPFDTDILHASMYAFEEYFDFGIGGRDATIIATMRKNRVNAIATHDRNMLRIPDFLQIDPTYDPPLILKIGQRLE